MTQQTEDAGRLRNTLVDVEFLRKQPDGLIIVDVRHQLSDPAWGEAAYREGHIPGALFIHLDRDLSGPATGQNGRHPLPEPETFRQLLAEKGIDGSRQVVVYDQDNGSFAARLWWMLNKWLGLDCAAVLDGGLAAWTKAGLPLETGAHAPKAQKLTGPASGVLASRPVTMQQMRENIETPDFLVIDARGAERYSGQVEPMDRVAGHIPGALNRPFPTNLAPDGHFKSPDVLRGEWLELLQGHAPADIVHHCGSGVTGCHNMLAMEHAGLSGSRLYAGSWSEWSSHPENPMVTGPASAKN